MEHPPAFPVGTILHRGENPVAYDMLIEDLASVPLVFVGEQHTRPDHHDIQLRILKSLHHLHPDLLVGMEMFARTYDEVLQEWVSGAVDEKTFLQRTHWYANWKFDYSLYRPILDFSREHRIPTFGLNIPFHIPPKIAAGGIDSLTGCDAAQLPAGIDLSDTGHREYVRKVYEQHAAHGPEFEFEHFYAAQVVWEDVMAESISRHIDNRTMVVFAGNGHITRKFGIPERARSRTGKPYRTVIPTAANHPIDPDAADYIWITPPAAISPHGP